MAMGVLGWAPLWVSTLLTFILISLCLDDSQGFSRSWSIRKEITQGRVKPLWVDRFICNKAIGAVVNRNREGRECKKAPPIVSQKGTALVTAMLPDGKERCFKIRNVKHLSTSHNVALGPTNTPELCTNT
jgi:hypothetical protein